MPEDLWDTMTNAADALHWLGKYTESNVLILASRLARLHELDTLDKWAAWIERQEEANQAQSRV